MSYNLDQCKKCEHKGFDFKTGINCNLSNEKPAFSGLCKDFELKPGADSIKTHKTSPYSLNEGHVNGWMRFANYIIDIIAFYALFFVVVTAYFSLSGYRDIEGFEFYVLVYGLYIFYYTLFEVLFGQTVGKLVTGTIVVTSTGDKPTFGKILGRSFSRIIPFEVFSFLGENASGWHDSLTDTVVVQKSVIKNKLALDKENLLDTNL